MPGLRSATIASDRCSPGSSARARSPTGTWPRNRIRSNSGSFSAACSIRAFTCRPRNTKPPSSAPLTTKKTFRKQLRPQKKRSRRLNAEHHGNTEARINLGFVISKNSHRWSSTARRSLDHLLRRDEFVAFTFVFCDQLVCRDYGLRAVRAHRFVAAIMQKNYFAAANSPRNFALDHLGRGRIPVVSGDVPHDRH